MQVNDSDSWQHTFANQDETKEVDGFSPYTMLQVCMMLCVILKNRPIKLFNCSLLTANNKKAAVGDADWSRFFTLHQGIIFLTFTMITTL